MNVGSFIGSWPINFTTGPLSKRGEPLAHLSTIEIGTGHKGARRPHLNECFEVKVGFALLDERGKVIFSSGDDPGRLLTLADHQLRWHGPYEGEELNINIALAEVFRQDEIDHGFHPYLFGCTVYGDPDQVGVWGASGSTGTPNPRKHP